MSEFDLVDLISQRDVVRDLLRGKSKAEIVEWLSARGRLVSWIGKSGHECFHFESNVGLQADFFFQGDDFIFVADHTTFR